MSNSILFLDDEGGRHEEFVRLVTKRGDSVHIEHAYTAAQAIALLGGAAFVQVFLDHDLGEGDPGVIEDASWGPSGMTVVDHIIAMAQPPQDVIVHSMNAPARLEMARRLNGSGRIREVRAIPFYDLIARMR
jgi:CheY-like chemotaxis protein